MTIGKTIFVFGSNREGRHGAGAALYARKHHGAIYGQGVGLQGNSYAIPTKGYNLKTLPLVVINAYVAEFLTAAYHAQQKNYTFNVTPIGCGLAGYTPEDIAPMFYYHPSNVNLPTEFKEILCHERSEHVIQHSNQV